MSIVQTDDTLIYLGGDVVLQTGTYTATGTSGTITASGLGDAKYVGLTSTAGATQPKYSISGNVITVTCASGDTGTWIIVGTTS